MRVKFCINSLCGLILSSCHRALTFSKYIYLLHPSTILLLTVSISDREISYQMDSKKSLQSVFTELCSHREKALIGNNQRLTFHKCIKQHYPNHYVVSVDPEDNAAFLDYAETGLAKATLDTDDDHVERQRRYKAPRSGRVYKEKGKVVDRVYFGKYNYEWRGKEFV